jgi:hypothetical protein
LTWNFTSFPALRAVTAFGAKLARLFKALRTVRSLIPSSCAITFRAALPRTRRLSSSLSPSAPSFPFPCFRLFSTYSKSRSANSISGGVYSLSLASTIVWRK